MHAQPGSPALSIQDDTNNVGLQVQQQAREKLQVDSDGDDYAADVGLYTWPEKKRIHIALSDEVELLIKL